MTCRLTPKGGRDGVDGVAALSDGTVVLACRVREAPEDGRANEALCRLIAKTAGVAASRARVAAGAKARVKQIALEGDPDALMAALALAVSRSSETRPART
ncbi:MAG: DUF167 domain-containing protein [Pseudomonadota bacterium]|nr:DUF167 domain-containing protein [Pseudomonadota bacterium]